jgi:RNA polymerase sigma factor (sigma-70 family)
MNHSDRSARGERNDCSSLGVLLRVGSLVRSMLAGRFGRNQADDLSQETFLRFVTSPVAEEIRHPKALLLRIATNVAYDQRRRVMARGGGLAVSLEDAEGDLGLSVAADQEQAFLLKQIILSMPVLYRDVFLLSRFSGLSYEEIARRCDVSVKTVEWRMSKALAHCAALLRDD